MSTSRETPCMYARSYGGGRRRCVAANNAREPSSVIRLSSYKLNYRPAVFNEIISIQILSEFGVSYVGNMTGTFY
jgi:hypothetical protein